jgi:hypothetical protein
MKQAKKKDRKLLLRRDTVRALSRAELVKVDGGDWIDVTIDVTIALTLATDVTCP